jgi:hypothetical protein
MMGTHHCEIAGRVAETPLVLLEGCIVLLVDDDQPEVRNRGEHGRARAEHDAGVAAEGIAPGEEPLVIGQGRMQHRHRRLEARAKTLEKLRRQSDLRHEQQRAPAGAQHLLDEPQVDLGLAAAGDPVQHERAVPIERCRDGHNGRALLG